MTKSDKCNDTPLETILFSWVVRGHGQNYNEHRASMPLVTSCAGPTLMSDYHSVSISHSKALLHHPSRTNLGARRSRKSRQYDRTS